MGNTISDQTNQEIDQQNNIKNSFIGETEKLTHFKKGQFLKEIENEFYGNAKIYQCSTSKTKWALKDKYFGNSKQLYEFLEACKIYEELQQCEFLTILIAHFTINLQNKNTILFNDNQYKVYLSYQYQNSNLRKEIRKKRQEKTYFMEQEIVLMIQCVLQALIYLENNGIYHQNITADTILYTDNQTYQIGIQQFITNQTHYQKCFQSPTEYLNLSPELFQQLKHRTTNPVVDKVKSDVFSLGLCALQMVRLGKVNSMYECDGFFIQEKVRNTFLEQIVINYSENLQQLISMMLEIDPEDRLNFDQALQISIDMYGDLTNIKQKQQIPKQIPQTEIKVKRQISPQQQFQTEIKQQSQISPQQFNQQQQKQQIKLKSPNNRKIFENLEEIKKSDIKNQDTNSSQRSRSIKNIPNSNKFRSISQIPSNRYKYKSPEKVDLAIKEPVRNKSTDQSLKLYQKISDLEKKLEERNNISQNQNSYKEPLHSKFLDNIVSHLNIHLHQSLTPEQIETFLQHQEYKSENLISNSPEKLDYKGKQYANNFNVNNNKNVSGKQSYIGQYLKQQSERDFQEKSDIKFNTEPDFQYNEIYQQHQNEYNTPYKQNKNIKVDEYLTTHQTKVNNPSDSYNNVKNNFTNNVFSEDLKKSHEIPNYSINNTNNNQNDIYQISDFQINKNKDQNQNNSNNFIQDSKFDNKYENLNSQYQQRPQSQFTFSKQDSNFEQKKSSFSKKQEYNYSSDQISLMKKSNLSLKKQMENLEKKLDSLECSNRKNEKSTTNSERQQMMMVQNLVNEYSKKSVKQSHIISDNNNNNSNTNKISQSPYKQNNQYIPSYTSQNQYQQSYTQQELQSQYQPSQQQSQYQNSYKQSQYQPQQQQSQYQQYQNEEVNNKINSSLGYKPYVSKLENTNNFTPTTDYIKKQDPVTTNVITEKLNSARLNSLRRSVSPIDRNYTENQQQSSKYKVEKFKTESSPVPHEYITKTYINQDTNSSYIPPQNYSESLQNKSQFSNTNLETLKILKPIDIKPISQQQQNEVENQNDQYIKEHSAYYNYQKDQNQQEILQKISDRAQKLQDYIKQSKENRQSSYSPSPQKQSQIVYKNQNQENIQSSQQNNYNFLQLSQNSQSPQKNQPNTHSVRQATSIYVNQQHEQEKNQQQYQNYQQQHNNFNYQTNNLSKISERQEEKTTISNRIQQQSLREENQKMQQLLDKFKNSNVKNENQNKKSILKDSKYQNSQFQSRHSTIQNTEFSMSPQKNQIKTQQQQQYQQNSNSNNNNINSPAYKHIVQKRESYSPNKPISQLYNQKIDYITKNIKQNQNLTKNNNNQQKQSENYDTFGQNKNNNNNYQENNEYQERSSSKSNNTLASSKLTKINLNQDNFNNISQPTLPQFPKTSKQNYNNFQNQSQQNQETTKKLPNQNNNIINHNRSKSFFQNVQQQNQEGDEETLYMQFASKDKYDVKLNFQYSQEYLQNNQ